MLACDLSHIFTTRHPGQLVHARIALHPLDLGAGATAPGPLADDEMAIREGGNLGQMRNAENLVLRRQLGEYPTDPFCDGAADPRVHLIEHDHHVAIRTPERILDRQKETR
jgi:hypothetical protein